MTATNGTPENHITYFHDFYDYGISYMKQGVQILTGDGGDECDVLKIVAIAPEAENLTKFYIKEMYSSDSKLPSEYPLADLYMCSNGNWDFFPTKVRYEKYTLENQPNKPEWDQYFMSRIKEESDVTPLIYVEAYIFDWNKDGIEDAFVTAGNTFPSNEDAKPNPPYYDHTAVYTITAFFLSGEEPLETSGYVTTYLTKEPVNEKNEIYRSYNKLENDFGDHMESAIQYDSKGGLIICPIFTFEDYDGTSEDDMILCDIDGDGNSELIVIISGIYNPIIVYKLVNGKQVEVFRVGTGA